MANKGETIAAILKKHKGNITASDAVTEAAAAGVDTTPNYVALIRSKLVTTGEIPRKNGEKRGRKPAAAPVVAPVTVATDFTSADLLAVKALSVRFGGLDKVADAVAGAVAKLRELAS